MNNFEFYSPTFFVFGKDTENKAGEYVKKFSIWMDIKILFLTIHNTIREKDVLEGKQS